MAILVAGATGNVGAAVVRALSEARATVKGLSRDPSAAKAQALANLPGFTLVRCDLGDKGSLAGAFDGVEACFLCCSNSESQVSFEINLIDVAAAASSCGYLVKIGTCGAPGYTAADSVIQYGRYHAEIESHLAKSSVKWTVLRPNYFMQNHMGDIFGSLPAGVVAFPMKVGARARIVDARDVGALAAKLLALPAAEREMHAGKCYDVCGPSSISTSMLAKLYQAALGRPIQAVKVPAEGWRAEAEKAGFPGWLAQAVSNNFTIFWEKGALDYKTSDEVLELLTPKRTMQQWVREHAPLSPPPPLKKPEFIKVKNIEPESTGINLKVKVAKSGDGLSDSQSTEVLLGDDSGGVVLCAESSHAQICSSGASLRVQNAKCRVVKGYMRLFVDKWGVVKPSDEAYDFEPNIKNNISNVEYELAA